MCLEARFWLVAFIGEKHAVVEGILAAQVVAEDDVRSSCASAIPAGSSRKQSTSRG